MVRSALALLTLLGGSYAVPSAPVLHTQRFQWPVERLTWAGAPAVSCDVGCRKGCLGAETTGTSGESWGDVAAERVAACLASCGCAAGFERLFASLVPAAGPGGGVFSSTDGGASWRELIELLPKPAGLRAYRITSIHVSAAEPKNVVLLTNISTALISRDAGSTWRALKTEGPLLTWQWHATNKDWALATLAEPAAVLSSTAAASKVPRSNAKPSLVRALYTLDAGGNFSELLPQAVSCRWAHEPHGNPSRVLAVLQAPVSGPGTRALKQLVASNDFMRTREVLIGKDAPAGGPAAASALRFHFSYIFAVAPAFDNSAASLASASQLWVRNVGLDGHGHPALASFRPVQWPGNVGPPSNAQQRAAEILHSSEQAVIFFLPSADVTLPWGHIFRCDAASAAAVLLLSDVHRPGDGGMPQWRPVAGIEGVYIVNRAVIDVGQDLDAVERQFDEQAVAYAVERDALVDSGEDFVSEEVPRRLRLVVRSYVSVDAGAVWQALQLAKGSGDRLQLATWTSSVAAPGVLLGVGNVGPRLTEEAEKRDVFLSRDAGLTWKLVLKGNHQVTMLSYGDALVAMPTSTQGALKYSTDSGQSWQEVTLHGKLPAASSVEGLFAHPSHIGWRVYVAARSETGAETTLLTADLSTILSAPCKKSGAPQDIDSDFERWSPADALEDAHASKRPVCVFGVKTRYVRRRPERQCRTVDLRLTPVDLRKDTPCACTMADWACNAGFVRASYRLDAACEPVGDAAQQLNVTALCSNTIDAYINVSRGYVKIPGNRCSGGIDLAPRSEVCVANTGVIAMIRRSGYITWARAWLLLAFLAFGAYRAHHAQQLTGRTGKAGARTGSMRLVPMPACCGAMLGARVRAPWKKADCEDEEECEFLINGNNI